MWVEGMAGNVCQHKVSKLKKITLSTLQWRHNWGDGISNHPPHDCLLNRLFRRRSKKTSKLRVTGLCGGNSPVTDEFPAQMASNAEDVSIWWRHHDLTQVSTGIHYVDAISFEFRTLQIFFPGIRYVRNFCTSLQEKTALENIVGMTKIMLWS